MSPPPAPTLVPDSTGHFGPYGGMFVPETLMAALHELARQGQIKPAQVGEAIKKMGLDPEKVNPLLC